MAMETGEMYERINDLMHLDVDAVRAYDEAIEKVDDAEVSARLREYRQDHQRHVEDLRAAVMRVGGQPEEARPDFKGMLIEGMTKLRSAMGEEQALKAMRQNEETTNRDYREALGWDMPEDIRDIFQRGYEDEQRHLRYIEDRLSVAAGSTAYGGRGSGYGTGGTSGYGGTGGSSDY